MRAKLRLAFVLMFLMGATLVPAAPAHATHLDCDDPAVTVYCDADLWYDSAADEISIRGVMAGWQSSNLRIGWKVWRNGTLIWSEMPFSTCFSATSCDRTDWLPNCGPGNYEVRVYFWSDSQTHQYYEYFNFWAA